MIESAVTVDLTGKILKVFKGASSAFIQANTSDGDVIIHTDTPENRADYWDFNLDQFVSIGNPPTPNHTFDYVIKEWVDLRTLDEIKAQRWTGIKSERDRIEFGGFEFDGDIYDSDQVSQGRILGAVLAGLPQIWTLANNTTVSLSAEQLKSLYAALQMHVAVAHERGGIAREAIQAATTKEQIEAIVF